MYALRHAPFNPHGGCIDLEILSNEHNHSGQLGWITAAISTAGLITSSLVDARSQKNANETLVKSGVQQIEATRIAGEAQTKLSQMSTERVKMIVYVGGGLLITGLLIWSVTKRRTTGTRSPKEK